MVNFAYGRRGATLQTGTKTVAPVDYDTALRTYNQLVASKVVKGYTPGELGTPYDGSGSRHLHRNCWLAGKAVITHTKAADTAFSTTAVRSACTLTASSPTTETTALPKRRTLADLSWQEFELVIGELYRRQGYAVRMCSGDGADGGVDLTLRKDGQTALVQCKHWKVYQVGVSTVRELFGVLTAEKADHAILVTTGKFTRDARSFAAGKALELIEGNALDALIRRVGSNGEVDLLDVVG